MRIFCKNCVRTQNIIGIVAIVSIVTIVAIVTIVSIVSIVSIISIATIKKSSPAAPWSGGGLVLKEAATYSPALHCSTIGAGGLNFSVRDGKRWDPAAITTWMSYGTSPIKGAVWGDMVGARTGESGSRGIDIDK